MVATPSACDVLMAGVLASLGYFTVRLLRESLSSNLIDLIIFRRDLSYVSSTTHSLTHSTTLILLSGAYVKIVRSSKSFMFNPFKIQIGHNSNRPYGHRTH